MRTTIGDGATIGGGRPPMSAQAREELQLRGQIIELWVENRRLERELQLHEQSNPDRSRRLAASLGDCVSLAAFWAENCPRPARTGPRQNVTVVDGVTIIGGIGAPVSAPVREQGRLRRQIAELWFDNKQLEQRLRLCGDFNANHEPPGSPEGGRFAEGRSAGASVHLANSRGRGGGGPRRFGPQFIETTPAQAARLEATGNLADRAIAEANEVLGRELDGVPLPGHLRFRAEPSYVGADAESRIVENESLTRQARAELQRRLDLAHDPHRGGPDYDELRGALGYEIELHEIFTRSSAIYTDFRDSRGRTWDLFGSVWRDRNVEDPNFMRDIAIKFRQKLGRPADVIGLDVSNVNATNAQRIIDNLSTTVGFPPGRIQILRPK